MRLQLRSQLAPTRSIFLLRYSTFSIYTYLSFGLLVSWVSFAVTLTGGQACFLGLLGLRRARQLRLLWVLLYQQGLAPLACWSRASLTPSASTFQGRGGSYSRWSPACVAQSCGVPCSPQIVRGCSDSLGQLWMTARGSSSWTPWTREASSNRAHRR